MADQDFKILLGVELKSDAESSLNKQINGLNLEKIKLEYDDQGTAQALRDIRNGIKKLNKANSIKITLNDTKVKGQIDSIKQQIKALGNIKINLGGNGNSGGIKNTINAQNKALRETANLYKQIESMDKKLKSLRSSGIDSGNIDNYEKTLNNLRTAYAQLMNNLGGKNVNLDDAFAKIDDSKTKIAELSRDIDNAKTKLAGEIKLRFNAGDFRKDSRKVSEALQEISDQSTETKQAVQAFEAASNNLDLAAQANDVDRLVKSYEDYIHALKRVKNQLEENSSADKKQSKKNQLDIDKENFKTDLDLWAKENSAALKKFGAELESIRSRVDAVDDAQLKGLRSELDQLTKKAKIADVATESLFDKLKSQFKQYSTYLSVAEVFSYAEQALVSMYDNVIELDSAMTNLYKVTDATPERYNQFLSSSAKSSQELGRSMSSFIEQTANWAKMDFSIDDSEKLAELSSIYANVAEVDDATAVSDMVTAMKAFGIEASEAITIVDSINKLSNEFAVTASGLGDGLSKAASTMATSGTDLEHTLALLTGISEITQSPDEAGNFLKTALARIQGMKGELEELGEEVDSSVDSISKVQTQILNLTGVNIFDENDEFRDYYYIMEDIAKVVDELSSSDRALLYEILFGKNRMNQGAAMIQAFQSGQIKNALDAALDSEGSAYAEQEKIAESLQNRLNALESAWENLSRTFLDSDFLKGAITGLTNFVNALTEVIDKIGTIPTILTALSAGMSLFKNKGIFTFDNGSISAFNIGLTNLASTYKKVTTGLNTYNSNLSKSVGLQNAYVKAVGNQNSSLGKYLSNLNGAKASMRGYIASLVAAKTATVALQAVTMVMNAALTMGVSYLVSNAISAFSEWYVTEEELAEKIDEVTTKYNEQTKALQGSKSELDSIKSEYAELAQGVDEFGNKVNLTDDEFSKHNELVNQIADMFPTLIQGYTNTGDAILTCKGNVEALTAALDAAYKTELMIANDKVLKNADSIFEDFNKSKETFYNDYANAYKGINDFERDFLEEALSHNNIDQYIRDMYSSNNDDGQFSSAITTIADILESEYGLERDERLDFWNGESKAEFVANACKENKGIIESIIADFDKRINESAEGMQSLASAYISSQLIGNDDYNNIQDSMQVIISSLVSQFDYKFFSQFDSVQALYDHLNTMLDDFKGLNDDQQLQIDTYVVAKAKFNNNEITADDYIKNVNDVKSAISGLDEETRKNISISLDLEGAEDIISQRDSLINNLINRGVSEEIAIQFAGSLKVNDLSFASDFSNNFSKEAIEAELEKLQEGGSVDLKLRPTIDASVLKEAGFEDAGEGLATVFTKTFSNEAKDVAMNFTPIIADENGNYIGVLSPDELQTYAESVIAGTRDDDLNLQIGTKFEGKNAISEAESAAEKIHQLQELYYTDFSDFTPEGLYEFFVEYKKILSGISDEPLEIQNILNDDAFKQIDEYKEQVEAIYETLAKLKSGESLTFDEQSNLIAMFPDLAGKTNDVNTLTIALQELLNTIYLNTDGTSQLDQLFNGWVESAGGATTEVGQQILALKDVVVGSFKDLDISQIASFDELINNDVFKEKVDTYKEEVETLKETLASLQNGEFDESDFIELVDIFPELASEADNLDVAIRNLLESKNVDMKSFFDQFNNLETGDDVTALDNFMNAVLKLGEVVGNTQFSIDIDVETGNMQSLYDAINESVSGKGLSTEAIKNIESMYSNLDGYNPSKLFEKTENGIHLNAKELRSLQSEYENFKKNGIVDTLQDLKQEYNNVQQELANLDKTAADFEQKKLELEFKSSGIEDRIQELQTLQAQFEGFTSAYNKWLEAQSTTDEDDMYNKVSDGLEGGKELFESGRIGTDDFRQFVQMMTDEDLSNASVEKLLEVYKQGMPLMEKFFTGNSDGLLNFLNAAKKASDEALELGEITKPWVELTDGEWTIDFGVGGDGEIAKAISEMTGLSMSTEQVQYLLRALSAYGFDINLDAAYASLDTLKSKVEGTEEYVKSFGEEPVEINIYCKEENLETTIKDAQAKIKDLRNSDLTIEANAAKLADAEAKLDVLIKRKLELENPTFMQVSVSQVDDAGLQEALTLLQNYQTAVNNVKELEIKGADTSEIETAKQKVDEYATSINSLPEDVKTKLGLTADDTETLKAQIAGIEAEVFVKPVVKDPVNAEGTVDETSSTVTIEAQFGESINALGERIASMNDYVATITIDAKPGTGFDTVDQQIEQYNQKIATATIDATTGTGFNTVDQEVSKYNTMTPEVTVGAKFGESYNATTQVIAALGTITKTITIDAEPSESFNNISKDIDSIGDNLPPISIKIELDNNSKASVLSDLANIGNDLTPITIEGTLGQSFVAISQGLSTFTSMPQTVTIEGKLGSSFSSISSALDKLKNSDDVEVEVEAEVEGQDDLDTMVETIEELEDHDYEVKATTFGQEELSQMAKTNKEITDVSANVTANVFGVDELRTLKQEISTVIGKSVNVEAIVSGTDAVNALADAIRSVKSKSVTVSAKVESDGLVNGTAHYRGTAYANGTSGRAYKQGSWGTKDSGVALGGELGMETVVRGGRFFTIGDNGAEFFNYEKNDIIFNHKQTEELFKYGKVISSGGRGRVYANGTAFAEGTAFSGGTGSITVSGNVVTSSSSSNKAQASRSSKKKSKEDDFEETFDWIEVAIDRIERAIDDLDLKVNSTYRLWSERNKALKDEMSEITGEISIQQKGYARYIKEANSVGLSESWAKLVRNGAIDIDTVKDEELAEKIKEYKEWYFIMLLYLVTGGGILFNCWKTS